ncbi:hypothetical protein REPUB_Repub13aG0236900 [Reevesia pubescens]
MLWGCDASILIGTKPGSKILAEKDAEDNKDLRAEGFDTIMKAKTLVESKCPGIVSCADILAIAVRDFVHLERGRCSILTGICVFPSEERKLGWEKINGIEGSLQPPTCKFNRRSTDQTLQLKGVNYPGPGCALRCPHYRVCPLQALYRPTLRLEGYQSA